MAWAATFGSEHELFARNEIARLEELRLVALTLRLEADLALGRHAESCPNSKLWCASIRCASGCGSC